METMRSFDLTCITCLRFSSTSSFNHPALADKVIRINDKIYIDIVLGFPETEEEFFGLLTISEYVT